MLASFYIPETSKELYFKLNHAFHLADNLCSSTYRYAGIYAIYQKDVCYYVGQSKNLPSRIATHLTGKYENADKIEFFLPTEHCFDNFHNRTRLAQDMILEANEIHCINCLKPIENILTNRDEIIPENQLFYGFTYEKAAWDMALFITAGEVTITDNPKAAWEIDHRLIYPLVDECIAVSEYETNKKKVAKK